MTARVEPEYLDPEASIGETAQGKLLYYVLDEADATAAHTAALARFQADHPAGYRGMPLKSTGIKHVTASVFHVWFDVGLQQNQARESVPSTSTFNTTTTFHVVGGTSHVTNSLAVVQTQTRAGFTAMDFGGAIGVEYSADKTNHRVKGCDILTPVMDYSLTTQFRNAVVNNAYIDTVFALTGTVNNATFYGRPAGTVLFKGARGSKRGQDLWEIGFEFAYQPSKTNFSVGSITGLNKVGWQYVDVLYTGSGVVRNGCELITPAQVFVHKVYEDGDFSGLQIGTSY